MVCSPRTDAELDAVVAALVAVGVGVGDGIAQRAGSQAGAGARAGCVGGAVHHDGPCVGRGDAALRQQCQGEQTQACVPPWE